MSSRGFRAQGGWRDRHEVATYARALPLHLLPVAILAAALAFVSAPAPGLWAAQASYRAVRDPRRLGWAQHQRGHGLRHRSDIGHRHMDGRCSLGKPGGLRHHDRVRGKRAQRTGEPRLLGARPGHPRVGARHDLPCSYPGDRSSRVPRGILEDVLVSTEPEASPLPVPSSTADHTTVFAGDATGVTDVTDALRVFLESNDGARVALAPNGVYAVTQLTFTAHDLVVDFRGARIQGIQPRRVEGSCASSRSSHIELNDATVYGTGVRLGTKDRPERARHLCGRWLGHRHSTIPTTRDTRGDGIYTGYHAGQERPSPSASSIKRPGHRARLAQRHRAGRRPGDHRWAARSTHTGLHCDRLRTQRRYRAPASIVGVVDGVDIRHHGDIRRTSSRAATRSPPVGIRRPPSPRSKVQTPDRRRPPDDHPATPPAVVVQGQRLGQRARPRTSQGRTRSNSPITPGSDGDDVSGWVAARRVEPR